MAVAAGATADGWLSGTYLVRDRQLPIDDARRLLVAVFLVEGGEVYRATQVRAPDHG